MLQTKKEEFLKYKNFKESVLTSIKWDISLANCKLPEKNKTKKANTMDNIAKEVSDISLLAVVSEVNSVESNPKGWWLDTGATRHVCSDKATFSNLVRFETGEKLYMGNSQLMRSRINKHCI